MSFVDNNGMYMPVAPANGNGGFGDFGGGGWWVILFLFALMGNNGWGGFGGGNGDVIPYLLNQNTQNDVNRGFDNAALAAQISSIQSTLNSNTIANLQATYQAQIADLQQAFNGQTQMASCCCDLKQQIAQLGSDLAREACADRQAVADGVQTIITQMCNDKIDAKNEKIAELQGQLNTANLSAMLGANTSRVLADNAAQTMALEQYLNPTPIPAYPVPNPNCCGQNYGCGCNGGFYN